MDANYYIKWVNALRPTQNGRQFADEIFKSIFFNVNYCILTQISLKYVLKGPIDNKPVLPEIMVWCPTGDKSLSKLMIV